MSDIFRDVGGRGSPWPAVLTQLFETSRVEYKSAEVLDKQSKYRLQLACLAMANNEDGGHIVVGVKEVEDGRLLEGISQDQLNPAKLDSLKIEIVNSGSPNLEIEFEIKDYSEKVFLLITVLPSKMKPVVSTASGGAESRDGLRPGVIYCRNSGPESKPITAAQWDILWQRFARAEFFAGQRNALELVSIEPNKKLYADKKFQEQAEDI